MVLCSTGNCASLRGPRGSVLSKAEETILSLPHVVSLAAAARTVVFALRRCSNRLPGRNDTCAMPPRFGLNSSSTSMLSHSAFIAITSLLIQTVRQLCMLLHQSHTAACIPHSSDGRVLAGNNRHEVLRGCTGWRLSPDCSRVILTEVISVRAP